MRRKSMMGLVILLLGAVVGACAPAAAPTAQPAAPTAQPAATTAAPAAPTVAPVQPAAQPVRGGTLTVAVEAESVTFDPALSVNVTERHVLYSVYNTLVAMDEKLNLKPELAKSWEQTDKALTLKLQEGVKFQDGTDFDAEAVKFNINRILDPKTGSGQRTNIDAISSVDVVDKYTVRFNLSRPYTPLLGYLAERPGFMVSPAAVAKFGDKFGQNPVGTGPFTLTEWVKDDHATLKRFDGYWEKGLPYLDQVTIKPIPDQTVKLANLKAGALDLVDVVAPKDVQGLKDSKDYFAQVLAGTRWPMLRLNNSKPPFNNKALRQAVALAVDRDAIVNVVYFGLAVPAYGPVAPLYTEYFQGDALAKDYSLDITKAKAKLAEAGMPNGFTFTINILQTPVDTRLAEVIQAGLAKAGITAKIAQYEPTVWQDKVNKSDFDAAQGSWTPRPDVDGVVFEHFYTKGRVNSALYGNPAVDKILDQTRLLPNGPDRVKAYKEVERMIVDDEPWTFLIFESKATAGTAKVKGLPAIPDTMLRFKTVWLSK